MFHKKQGNFTKRKSVDLVSISQFHEDESSLEEIIKKCRISNTPGELRWVNYLLLVYSCDFIFKDLGFKKIYKKSTILRDFASNLQ